MRAGAGSTRRKQVLYVWSGSHVRRLSPGLENVLADVYWLRTVQYFGGQRAFATDKRFDLLAPLIDITTTLDPRFEMAYRYGAVFLAEPPTQRGGAAGRGRRAARSKALARTRLPGRFARTGASSGSSS